MSVDPAQRRAAIRREIVQMLREDNLYENDTLWRVFAATPEGVTPDRFHVFGSALADVTYDDIKTAFEENPNANVVVEDGKIRPAKIPSQENHIYNRTVHATPIHYMATEAEVQEFFSQWGTTERIERGEFTDPRTGNVRKSSGVLIVYATREEADKCIEAKPSYVSATGVGRFFIPKLQVTKRQAAYALRNDSVTERNLEHVAGAAAATQQKMSHAGKEHLVKGQVCTLSNLPEKVRRGGQLCNLAWRDIRNLTQTRLLGNDERTGGSRSVVYTLLDLANSKCYMILRDEKVASMMAELHRSFTFGDRTAQLGLASEEELAFLQSLPLEEAKGGKRKRTE